MEIQYILTGLAGILIGIVAMRIWQARESQPDDGATPEPAIGETSAGEAQAGPSAKSASPFSTRNLLIGGGVIAAIAIAIFAFRPEPEPASTTAMAGSSAAPGAQNLDDVDTMIDRLAARLEANPGDGEGFRMLGWSYVMTGRPQEALAPYKRAIELIPDKAVVHSGYGEALVGVADNTVTPEARKAFQKAVALDPTEPRARYFLALWQAQQGDEAGALDMWVALSNEGPADAPWQADVHRQIASTAKKLGVDVSGRLQFAPPSGAEPPPLDPATVQSASKLPASDRQAMIDGMVEGLAAKLAKNPKDADGWIRLMRSRMVMKQQDQASKDLATARAALEGDAAALGKINAAAGELGVPGA